MRTLAGAEVARQRRRPRSGSAARAAAEEVAASSTGWSSRTTIRTFRDARSAAGAVPAADHVDGWVVRPRTMRKRTAPAFMSRAVDSRVTRPPSPAAPSSPTSPMSTIAELREQSGKRSALRRSTAWKQFGTDDEPTCDVRTDLDATGQLLHPRARARDPKAPTKTFRYQSRHVGTQTANRPCTGTT